MTNEEKIKAAAEDLAQFMRTCGLLHATPEVVAEILERHFGESAPEQKEGELEDLRGKVSIMQAQFDDFKAMAFAPDGKTWQSKYETVGTMLKNLGVSYARLHREKAAVAPSVDTNAERTHEHEGACYDPQENGSYRKICEFADKEPTGRFPADASPQEPTCARCGEEESSALHDFGNGVTIIEFGPNTANDESHAFVPVESSVLPSKSERE